MKILQIVNKPQRRGAEIFALQLGAELRRQGHDVRTVYLYEYPRTEALSLCEYDCLLKGQESDPLEKFPGVQPRLLRNVREFIDQLQPDVVQAGGGRTVKYGAFAKLFDHNRSWALICRNIGYARDWLQGWHHRLVYQKLVMPRVDGVVSVTQATLQDFRELYALSVPITCIPTGIDPASLNGTDKRELIRREARTPLQAPVALYVGRLIPAKRPDRLLRVIGQARASSPDLYLWVVGDGPLRAELEQQAASLGIAEHVRFMGVQAQVGVYMRAADLFVLPSDSEGIPRVILEAGLVGLPVVSTRVGGIPEFVLHEETGLLVDPGDEADLVQAVTWLLQQPEQRRRMGEQAQALVRANYTMDKIARRYVDFYHQVRAG